MNVYGELKWKLLLMCSVVFLTKARERRPRVGTGATPTSLVETLDGE